jgi:RimJ/RimL family protein N-acetyltransferase
MAQLHRSAPTLETERLRLRAWRRDDRDSYWAILEEPAVYRYFGPAPASREENWRRMMAAAGSWQINGFGGWAVERTSDSRLVGMASLFNAWRALDPEFGEEPEMGWIFATETHGQGIAGEACRAVLDWAEATLRPTPIWAIIAPGNEPSFRLAERLGFAPVRESTYNGEPVSVLKRPPWA